MTKNYHTGGRDERRAWMRKVRSMLRSRLKLPNAYGALDDLLVFGLARVKRYRKRKGGL